MAGFKYRYRLSGGTPTIQDLVMKDAETLTEGDVLNLEAGQVDLGATADANLIGIALETVKAAEAVAGTTRIKCMGDADAVYGVTDPNARKVGDTLDLAGATGAQGVAASANKEFVVVADSSSTQETLVTVNADAHYLKKAQ